MTGFRHHDVPYFAQWASPAGVRAIVEDGDDPCADPLWREAGFSSEEEYRFWSRRICGLACLQSVLAHWAFDVPSRAELLRAALEWGAYRQVSLDKVEGLTYAPFAQWVTHELGLRAEVHGRLPLADLARHVADRSFVIASVSSEIRYPDRANSRRGGHLVLVHGCDEHGLSFHNPSGIPPYQADAYLDHDTFDRFYAARGVTIHRTTQDGLSRAEARSGAARELVRPPGPGGACQPTRARR